MAVSEWFSDEELISQFRMFFTENERKNINFDALLGQLIDINDEYWKVNIKSRWFLVDKKFCNVREMEL